MKLTNEIIINAELKDKDYKLFDGHGLYLLIRPSGGKSWRLKYRFNDKEQTLSFGMYPKISIEEARALCLDARYLLSKGIEPSKSKVKLPMSKAIPNLVPPIKLLRIQLKHLVEMQDRLESKKRELDDQLDMLMYDLNEITGFVEETQRAIKQLEK